MSQGLTPRSEIHVGILPVGAFTQYEILLIKNYEFKIIRALKFELASGRNFCYINKSNNPIRKIDVALLLP